MHPIALTTGEPAGIGPDLVIAAAQRAWPEPLVAIGDPQVLSDRARQLNQTLRLIPWRQQADPAPAQSLYIDPVATEAPVVPGVLDPAHADYVLRTLHRGASHALSRTYHALVTAPVHKAVINEAGHPFTGHTEFLAAAAGVERVVMMLACPGLKVALVTTHLPLRAVADAITETAVHETIRILAASLTREFAVDHPRILVSGLNPHAGESGHLGDEEIRHIVPALVRLRAAGIDVTGPLPADTLYTPEQLAQCDATVAMYHDQGLPVLKSRGFGEAVNITLGLPFVRTSVDHGTALDLAGTGRARDTSLLYAIDQAIAMAKRHWK